jgi:hypothetical protein
MHNVPNSPSSQGSTSVDTDDSHYSRNSAGVQSGSPLVQSESPFSFKHAEKNKTIENEPTPEQRLEKIEKYLAELNFDRKNLDDEKSKIDVKIKENLARSIGVATEAIGVMKIIKTKENPKLYEKKLKKLEQAIHMLSVRKKHLMTKTKHLQTSRRLINHLKSIEDMRMPLVEIIEQQAGPASPWGHNDEIEEALTLTKTIKDLAVQIRKNLEQAYALDTDEYGIYPPIIHENAKLMKKYESFLNTNTLND